jgi:hypothetical protein
VFTADFMRAGSSKPESPLQKEASNDSEKQAEDARKKASAEEYDREMEALQKCEAAFRKKLNNPSTFKTSWYPPEIKQTAPNTTTVIEAFYAKNAFGLEIGFTGICAIQPDGQAVVLQIQERGK